MSEDEAVQDKEVPPPEKPRLGHLDGFRFIVALWLVVAHNYNKSQAHRVLYQRFCLRRYVAVTFFLVLSGFVSQYAYGSRDFSSKETVRKFYIGRFGSIMACYYASQATALALRAIFNHYTARQWSIGVPLVTTLLQCWVPQYAYFGNTPGWTMSTLAAHWFAFPFLQTRLLKMTDRRLFVLGATVPIIALVPVIITLIVKGGSLNGREWYFFYTFPPLRFPDFCYGAILAEIFVRGHRPKILARLSDLVFPIVFALILFLPFSNRKSALDSIMIYAPMHLFGLLVFGSSCDPNSSFTARFHQLEICKRLGDFAFQVYLWRWPLFAWIQWIQDGYLKRGWMYLEPRYFIPGFIVLYASSYAWYRFVDNPLRVHLSKVTAPEQSNQNLATIEPSKGVENDTQVNQVMQANDKGEEEADSYQRMA